MKMLKRTLLILSLPFIIAGCTSVQPNSAYSGSNPSHGHLLKRFPNLIPSIKPEGQNRPPNESIIVLGEHDQSPAGFELVGMILTKPNPPARVIEEIVEFSKAAGLDLVRFGRPITTVRFGFSSTTYTAFVYIKSTL